MLNQFRLLVSAAVLIGATACGGSKEEPEVPDGDGPAEEAGESIDEAAEETEEWAEDAAEDVEETVEDDD